MHVSKTNGWENFNNINFLNIKLQLAYTADLTVYYAFCSKTKPTLTKKIFCLYCIIFNVKKRIGGTTKNRTF